MNFLVSFYVQMLRRTVSEKRVPMPSVEELLPSAQCSEEEDCHPFQQVLVKRP